MVRAVHRRSRPGSPAAAPADHHLSSRYSPDGSARSPGRIGPEPRDAGPGGALFEIGRYEQQSLLNEVENGGGDEAAGVAGGSLAVGRRAGLRLALGGLHGVTDEDCRLAGADGLARGLVSGGRHAAAAVRVRVDARQGKRPARPAERLALRRVPELGAARADVLRYLAVPFQVPHLGGHLAHVGVEPVSYRLLHVESPDRAVSLFDVQLYSVPDLRGVCRHGGSSQTQAARTGDRGQRCTP
jgi:hypothetical protein